MYILDNIVINHPYILKIKKILDNVDSKTIYSNDTKSINAIHAIYGSYLSIIYTLILNSIGYPVNYFEKYEYPLNEVDIDTMTITFLSNEELYYGNDFKCEKPVIIAYHTDIQPVQNSNIKTSSIDALINNCWDLNYTSAILMFENNGSSHVIRNPDFTEFLFGIQPLQKITGKSCYNLYNPELTSKRFIKAQTKWL